MKLVRWCAALLIAAQMNVFPAAGCFALPDVSQYSRLGSLETGSGIEMPTAGSPAFTMPSTWSAGTTTSSLSVQAAARLDALQAQAGTTLSSLTSFQSPTLTDRLSSLVTSRLDGLVQPGTSSAASSALINNLASLENRYDVSALSMRPTLVYDPTGVAATAHIGDYSFLSSAPQLMLSRFLSLSTANMALGDTFAVVEMPSGRPQAASIVTTLPQAGQQNEVVVCNDRVYQWTAGTNNQPGSWQEVIIRNPDGATVGAIQTIVSIEPPGGWFYPDGSNHNYYDVPVLTAAPTAAPAQGQPTVVVYNDQAYQWTAGSRSGTGTWQVLSDRQAIITRTVPVTIPGNISANQAWVADSLPPEGVRSIKTDYAMFYVDGTLYMQTTGGWSEVPQAEETPDYRVMQEAAVSIYGHQFQMVLPVVETIREITNPTPGETVVVAASGPYGDRLFRFDPLLQGWDLVWSATCTDTLAGAAAQTPALSGTVLRMNNDSQAVRLNNGTVAAGVLFSGQDDRLYVSDANGNVLPVQQNFDPAAGWVAGDRTPNGAVVERAYQAGDGSWYLVTDAGTYTHMQSPGQSASERNQHANAYQYYDSLLIPQGYSSSFSRNNDGTTTVTWTPSGNSPQGAQQIQVLIAADGHEFAHASGDWTVSPTTGGVLYTNSATGQTIAQANSGSWYQLNNNLWIPIADPTGATASDALAGDVISQVDGGTTYTDPETSRVIAHANSGAWYRLNQDNIWVPIADPGSQDTTPPSTVAANPGDNSSGGSAGFEGTGWSWGGDGWDNLNTPEHESYAPGDNGSPSVGGYADPSNHAHQAGLGPLSWEDAYLYGGEVADGQDSNSGDGGSGGDGWEAGDTLASGQTVDTVTQNDDGTWSVTTTEGNSYTSIDYSPTD